MRKNTSDKRNEVPSLDARLSWRSHSFYFAFAHLNCASRYLLNHILIYYGLFVVVCLFWFVWFLLLFFFFFFCLGGGYLVLFLSYKVRTHVLQMKWYLLTLPTLRRHYGLWNVPLIVVILTLTNSPTILDYKWT